MAAMLACHSTAGPGKLAPGEDCAVPQANAAAVNAAAAPTPFRVLVFTRHVGFAHQSIPIGIDAVRRLGTVTGFVVDATEDPTRFSDSNLAQYSVIVFLNTTGNVLDAVQQGAMERFITAGHGWVGVHSAADTEYDWPWYQAMLGARFIGHSEIQTATIVVTDTANASTRRLTSPLSRLDEWYDFASQPAAGTHILLRVDEASYSGGRMGALHPVSWLHDYAGGRAWFTSMGHTSCSYTEKPFLEHLRGGILWAAGMDTLTVLPLQ